MGLIRSSIHPTHLRSCDPLPPQRASDPCVLLFSLHLEATGPQPSPLTPSLPCDGHPPQHPHSTLPTLPQVYEPAEDTYLLLDAFQEDIDTLRTCSRDLGRDVDSPGSAAEADGARGWPQLCLEVGSGSGVVITFLARLIGKLAGPEHRCDFIATDLNPNAVAATAKTAEENGVGEVVRAVESDLVTAVANEVAGKIDVLVFNPPYVVTPPEEVGSHGIEASWAGGLDGREVTDRLLRTVPALLSPSGVFYLIVIDQNIKPGTPDDIRNAIPGFSCRVVIKRKAGRERLSVLCYSRSTNVSSVT
eukprot:m.21789 g.21789  ORF g.21789 m.21789 type:complete len:304 (+) comp10550_c0_seq1:98-1009(+)